MCVCALIGLTGVLFWKGIFLKLSTIQITFLEHAILSAYGQMCTAKSEKFGGKIPKGLIDMQQKFTN